MNDQCWTVAQILDYRNIFLAAEHLAIADEHLKSYRHHGAWCQELRWEHPLYPYHYEFSQAHLNHVLDLVYEHADFTRTIHSEDDGTGMLCCHDSWNPRRCAFLGPGCSLGPLDLDRRYLVGQEHPGDRLLKNMEHPQTFWEWYDREYGLDVELPDDL